MTEIDIFTTWNDSGYDCDHCGGRILKRKDQETGQPEQVCYQCEACGCQWSLEGDVLRVGHGDGCRLAGREREAIRRGNKGLPVHPLVVVVIGSFLLAVIVLLGGLAAIRYLIPIALFVLVATAVFQFGHDRKWW